nr:cytochrome c biogenesis C mitochondrion [Ipomoea trifida]GMC76314.1 cytochrome C biogenesis C mitochondrion [Ipomoea batatas]GMC79959.1 cytochrome C biogenesis C mitochondrion [Ipomoea batatas]GMD87911.1 cytochrome C biogenesis C mitochondrion [Ipomoea batatas]
MKRKLSIFQYGSQVDPAGPTRYSPSDWIDISVSESSPSERSCSIGAPPVSNSSISDDGEVTSASGEVLLRISRELERRMEEIGIDLPSSIPMDYFITFHILGEEEAGALDPSFLVEVLADLLLPAPILSWYWEVAFDSLCLIWNLF